MSTKGEAYLLMVYLLFPLLIYSQGCDKNPVIFNFGDSNSDTGGYVAESGIVFLPPYARTFFHQPSGRACDGRVVLDFLCESLNTSFLWPYLESLGTNFANGANFAIVGASILPRLEGFNLDVQLSQFFLFQTQSLKLVEQGYTRFIGKEGFKNALYIVDIGGNDLKNALTYLSYAEAVENVPSYVAEIRHAIESLYNFGGRKFWVHNSHPLGCLPGILTELSSNASDLDPYGCLRPVNELVRIFNDDLRVLSEQLRTELENATIVYVDIYAIRYDLIANATTFGFDANPVMACCGYGGPPYNFNSSILCGEQGYNVCEEGSRYVNWDGYHYTDAANAITVAKILTTKYNTPPLNFDFFVTTPSCSKYKLKGNVILDSSQ